MADIQEAIRRLSIQAESKGVSEATDDLKDLTKAHGDLVVASHGTEQASLSLDRTIDQLERKFVQGVKAQQDYEKVQRQVNAAVAQNPALQDRANVILDSARKKYEEATAGTSVFSKALGGVQNQMVALSAGAGPVGTFLAGFGPAGFAAAVGLGAATKAIDMIRSATEALQAKAQGLKNFADITGLSTNQIQALNEQAQKFGISQDQMSIFIDRFTLRITDLRNAQGPLYEQYLKLNPELAEQALNAKSTAEQISILARAYALAGSEGGKLLNTAGGRGSTQIGPVITSIDQSGGVASLTAAMQDSINLSNKAVERLNALKQASDQARSNALSNFQVWLAGGDTIAKHDLKIQQDLEGITRWLKDFSLPEAFQKFVDAMVRLDGIDVSKGFGKITTPTVPAFGAPAITYSTPSAPSQEALLNIERERVQNLGSAATAQERLNLQIKTYDDLLAKNLITQDTYNRAVAALRTDSSLQLEGQRLALLGDLAPVLEKVTYQTNQIAVARQRGVSISDEEAAAIKRAIEEKTSAARLDQQVTLGIASASDIAAQKQREFQLAVDNGAKSADQQATVIVALAKKYEDLAQRSAIAAAQLPGLKQLELQSGTLRTQLDTLGTGIVNGISNPLVQLASGAMKAGDAFKQMALNIINAIQQMIINMTVAAPIARGLQALLGGFLGVPTASAVPMPAQSGYGGIEDPSAWLKLGIGAGEGHTGAASLGMVAANRYIHPAYFDDAPRHHTGTSALGYDEVPFIGKKGEEIGWPDDLKKKYGGDYHEGDVQMNFNVDARGAQQGSAEQIVEALKKQIPAIAVAAVRDAKGRRGKGL